jgi:adenylate cyclase
LIDPTIAAHSGRIVKLMGDGALVEFASAVDAVTCAIEIQRQLRERDAAGSETSPIKFRIGINVGDIIIEGDDILGDGVNIAARIEGVAEPGGISLSEDAWRQVQGKVTTSTRRRRHDTSQRNRTIGPRQAVHRGAAVSEHERRSRAGLFR